ncbi:SRPBCC family protein [Nocardioides sp.]|uniref:SRPBCC family protein n=1 Tax=Nocardioides sp. TaxID=35761 RepID=UPI002C050E5B|nr:SRPBCC family protein [Nocardioides sp.]HSX68427.1 SRPBCC family protein [Nocardioides sp.]
MNVPVLEQSIEIAAPPAEVWALVSDLRRMPEWSPQVESVRPSAGHETIGLGARVTNRNVLGELAWITHAEVVRFEGEREIAFRIEENWSVWSFTVAPSPAGTRLTQRREAPNGLSPSSITAQETWLGGQAAFTQTLRDGMAETLERIRATVAATAA